MDLPPYEPRWRWLVIPHTPVATWAKKSRRWRCASCGRKIGWAWAGSKPVHRPWWVK